MQLKLYEEWMKPQIVDMFHVQYSVGKNEFNRLFNSFYEHSFQKDKSIRIVAIEGEVVIGFQSFFYWPYQLEGKVYNSYQSGNSLIHHEHRGKGIFQKLLNYFDTELQKKYAIDFCVGFPVEASLNSFIKNGWKNIIDLDWHVKFLNPIQHYISSNRHMESILSKPNILNSSHSNQLRLFQSDDFIDWRCQYSGLENYIHVNQSDNIYSLYLQLKPNKRKKLFITLNELVIGDIQYNTFEKNIFKDGIRKIHKIASSQGYTFLSIALNPRNNTELVTCLAQSGFKKIKKNIHFIVKPYTSNTHILSPESWTLFRSDVDTW